MKFSNKLSRFLINFNAKLTCLGNSLQSVFILLFRLQWGWQFFQTGKGKLLNHENVVEFFTSLNIPLPSINAWFVGGLECFGGLLILVGLFSRPVALLLSGNMLVAYLSVEEDRAKLFNIYNDVDSFLQADPFFFLLTSVLILSFGPGLFSIDSFLTKRFGFSNNKNEGSCCNKS